MIGDMQSGLDPVSSSDVRELTLQVGAWRSQLMARLDEQEMHLDEILGQLARQPRFPALGAIATTAPFPTGA